MPSLNRLTTSGAALASVLQEAALLRGPFDGLIFGKYASRTVCTMHDVREEEHTHVLAAHISSFCCFTSLGTFYDAAGEIDTEEMEALRAPFQEQLLGWFTHQHGPKRGPTLREKAICSALSEGRSADQPLLFALMTSALEPEGATVSFQQQFLQQLPGEISLRPVPLVIENMGSSQRTRDYSALRPVLGLQPVPSLFSDPDHGTAKAARGEGSDGNADQLRKIAVSGVLGQTEGLEMLFADLLQQLGQAADAVRREQQDLRAIQYDVDALTMSIGL